MRILFLTAETCPTFRADVTVLFGKYLPRHGIQSDIVAGRTPGTEEAIHWGGGEAYLCDVEGGAAKKHIKVVWHGIRHLFRADRSRYQAIQVRDMPVLGLFGLMAARLKGLKFFYWMSFPMSEGQIARARERGLSAGLMKFLYPWLTGRIGAFLLYRFVLPNADHVFVQSMRMMEDVAAFGVPRGRMTPVPMGVDLEAIQAEAIEPSNDPRLTGRRTLVNLGSLDRPRRIERLFDMLALVKQKLPEVLLVLVGDTEDVVHRDWLRQQAQKAGVADEVLWTGWLSMKEGWRYVRAAQIGLSPIPRGYLLDCSSPTKVPEYLALGVPVVCNDNPDQEEIVESSGAGTCVEYTAEGFANAVLHVFDMSAEQRSNNIQAGKSYVTANRDYAVLAESLASTYQRLISANSQAGVRG